MNDMLIVEDHPFVAESTKLLFSEMNVGHIEICNNSDEALFQLRANRSWYRIWLDINVPGASGLSLIRYVASLGLASRSAVITASDNLQWRADVASMGFLGYVLKTASIDEFNHALREIMNGRQHYNDTHSDLQPTHLTSRQIEILSLISIGLSAKQIARKLDLSPGTVNNHISNITNALSARDRAHAVALGIQYGYIHNHI